MQANSQKLIDSPLGKITIDETDGAISAVRIGNYLNEKLSSSPLLDKCALQLEEYFTGKRFNFGLPLAPNGTEFQKKMWNIINTIPHGQTLSYKDLAKQAGNAKAFRAAGTACGKNPICIIIPCHRVVKSDGSIDGYAYGTEMKEKLLRLEKDSKKSFTTM